MQEEVLKQEALDAGQEYVPPSERKFQEETEVSNGNDDFSEGIPLEGFDFDNMEMNEDGSFTLNLSPEQIKAMGLEDL